MAYNSYYYSNRSLELKTEEMSDCYNIQRIEKSINNAKIDIADLQEQIIRCQKYISFLLSQKEFVSSLNFRYEVHVTRYSYNRIEYGVKLLQIPNIPKGEKKAFVPCGDEFSKRFAGKERHLAQKFAEELAQKYKCAIIKK